jgi:tripartite-type tricarboxylate transporter receptor subunit TctC
MVRKRHLALMLATALMLVTSAVHSQTDFPNRRIHMMVPYPAGVGSGR